MSHTHIVRRGPIARMKNALAGIIIGPILLFVAIWFLSWNEHRAIERTRALTHGQDIVVAGNADAPSYDQEGALVYFAGDLTGRDPILDSVFGVQEDAVALRRDVWMYQWVETKRTKDDRTTYSYDKEWVTRHVDSSDFQYPHDYRNPPEFPYSDQTWLAEDISLGAVTLAEALRNEIDFFETLPLPETVSAPGFVRQGEWLSTSRGTPQVGDVRVQFEHVPEGPASAVGLFQQAALHSYQTEWGSLALIEGGTLSSDELFAKAHHENMVTTWVIRGVGVLFAGIGCALFISPLTTIVGFVPLIGPLLRDIGGLAALLFGALIGVCTIAVAWFAVRPFLSIGLIVAGVTLLFALRSRNPRKADDDHPARGAYSG